MLVNMKDYGFTQTEFSIAMDLQKEKNDLVVGRVIEHRRNLYKVVCEYGEKNAELKGSFFHNLTNSNEFPAVGDFVVIQHNNQGNSLITAVLPRRSIFSRSDFTRHNEEVVASNFDYVFIISSLNRDFNIARLARYLTASWQSGGFPIIVLTKSDICNDPGIHVAEAQKLAREAPVIPVSSKTGNGIENLQPFLESGKTVVFLGSSGVGKSSLLNCLAGEELMEAKSIRENDDRGRHTTSHRQLFRLHSGALIIDTPGLRELGLWDSNEGMSITFAEVEEFFSYCQFSNCTHQSEPGCAVQAALKDGKITQKQWTQYQKQQRETAFIENNSEYNKEKNKLNKSIALFSKDLKKGNKK